MIGVVEVNREAARIYGITERVVDLSGGHRTRFQHQDVLTYSEAVARIQSLQADPKHAAIGRNSELDYWWARTSPEFGEPVVRRWSIGRRH